MTEHFCDVKGEKQTHNIQDWKHMTSIWRQLLSCFHNSKPQKICSTHDARNDMNRCIKRKKRMARP